MYFSISTIMVIFSTFVFFSTVFEDNYQYSSRKDVLKRILFNWALFSTNSAITLYCWFVVRRSKQYLKEGTSPAESEQTVALLNGGQASTLGNEEQAHRDLAKSLPWFVFIVFSELSIRSIIMLSFRQLLDYFFVLFDVIIVMHCFIFNKLLVFLL